MSQIDGARLPLVPIRGGIPVTEADISHDPVFSAFRDHLRDVMIEVAQPCPDVDA